MAATAVALTGCSDDLEADLATCKAKAMEVDRSQHVSGEKLAAYVRECMIAEAWPLKDACLDKAAWWDTPECYLR